MISGQGGKGAPLRGALIGYGFIGSHGHLPAYDARARRQGDFSIEAIADPCAARRALAAARHPEMRIYEDYRTLLAKESHRLDFVDVCTPPSVHADIAGDALDAGLHVLCEKPLTTTLDAAEQLLEQARQVGRVLYPCHNYKHAPVVQAIRDSLATKRIGALRSVSLHTMRNTHAKGVTEWETHWRRHRVHSGGGIVMDHGSHSFYLLFDWFGAYPESATARLSNLTPERYDTEDNASIVLTFPQGLATVQLSWTAGVRKVQYSLQGDRGAITVDDDELQMAIMRHHAGPDIAQGAVSWDVERRSVASHWGDASHTLWFDSLFTRFARAIKAGEYVGREAMDAYQCVATIGAVYESAASACREVEIPIATSRAITPAPHIIASVA